MSEANNLLHKGETLGVNRVRRFIMNTRLGQYYEITMGSTTHVYGLFIADEKWGIDEVRLEAVVKPLYHVMSPCLAKPYAFGVNAGKTWIRTEMTDSVRLSSFEPEHRRGNRSKEGVEEASPRIEDANDLLAACPGGVLQHVLWPVVGDLLEGMSALHEKGIAVGDVGLDSIAFAHWNHHQGVRVVTKWWNYGMTGLVDPAKAGSWSRKDDLKMLAGHIRTLVKDGLDSKTAGYWPEWKDFLAKCEADDGFASALEAEEAFGDLLKSKRIVRMDRLRPEDDTSVRPEDFEDAEESPVHAHHRHHESGGKRSHARRGKGGKTFVFFLLLGLVACGVVWYQRKNEKKLAGSGGETAAKPEAETSVEINLPETPELVWTLSDADLEKIAALPEDSIAKICLAFRLASGENGVEKDADRAAELAKTAVESIEKHIQGLNQRFDEACDFWLGYAYLAGLGCEPDTAKAAVLLEKSAKQNGNPRALALLGDYYALGAEEGVSKENDLIASDYWCQAIDKIEEARWPKYGLDCAAKLCRFYADGRGLPETRQDEFVKRIETAAGQQRHVMSMLTLGRVYLDGKLAKMDETVAKKWYSEAATQGNADGMYQMAWMIQRGIASNPSDKAALTWYRRAAVSGNPDAMEAIASMLDEGKVKDEAGEAMTSDSGKTSAEWRAAAKEKRDAAAGAEKPSVSTWWMGRFGGV